jgi:hypothetical protein
VDLVTAEVNLLLLPRPDMKSNKKNMQL